MKYVYFALMITEVFVAWSNVRYIICEFVPDTMLYKMYTKINK